MGQARRLRRVHDESGLPPAPERLRHYSEPTLRARKRHDQRYGRGYGRGMKLVFIHGAPAAGKLTTARALLALQRIPVDLIHLVVMRGLDPRIHHVRKNLCEADGPAGQARG